MQHTASHTRNGGPAKIKLEQFTEALSDPSLGLAYPALIGLRKQSVLDAERLFSPRLAAFMVMIMKLDTSQQSGTGKEPVTNEGYLACSVASITIDIRNCKA